MTGTPAYPIALTIAGSDSSGGAGIQADLKTFAAFGVYGASVITALTAQNTLGVQGVHPIPAAFVLAQANAVLDDLGVGAAKTGMLAERAIVEAVAGVLERRQELPVVVDPVMVATSGDMLLAPGAVDAVRTLLLPRATLVTPNLPEAAALLGAKPAVSEPEVVAQGQALLSAGARAVLMKGGHGEGRTAVDLLVTPEGTTRVESLRIDTPHTHGTGCTLSAAITALIAQGDPLEQAVRRAKTFITRAIDHGRRFAIGHGHGPVDHLYAIRSGMPPA
jgi:hydroxymethylpyrimidine/phosphomethylpyrimidine kinase